MLLRRELFLSLIQQAQEFSSPTNIILYFEEILPQIKTKSLDFLKKSCLIHRQNQDSQTFLKDVQCTPNNLFSSVPG